MLILHNAYTLLDYYVNPLTNDTVLEGKCYIIKLNYMLLKNKNNF